MSTDKDEIPKLDHVFMWTEENGGETKKALDALGLVETYRRDHIGQGTANICYCFDNAFIELLWIVDEHLAGSGVNDRCQFVERARRGNPFGIAWRGPLTVPTWDFTPSYLPKDLAIKVAVDCDDIEQPFMFTFPGSKPPSALPAERKGALQAGAGFVEIEISEIVLRAATTRAGALLEMKAAGVIQSVKEGPEHSLHLKLKRAPEDARADIDLILPI